MGCDEAFCISLGFVVAGLPGSVLMAVLSELHVPTSIGDLISNAEMRTYGFLDKLMIAESVGTSSVVLPTFSNLDV